MEMGEKLGFCVGAIHSIMDGQNILLHQTDHVNLWYGPILLNAGLYAGDTIKQLFPLNSTYWQDKPLEYGKLIRESITFNVGFGLAYGGIATAAGYGVGRIISMLGGN